MADITPDETKLMQEYGQYWRRLMAEGHVVAFGPVAKPSGAFGIAVVRLADGVDVKLLTDSDPVIKANAGFSFETFPMPQAVHPAF